MDACCLRQTHIHDNFFSHPDYTVGPGISPDRLPKQFTDYTVGREYAISRSTLPRRIPIRFTVTILCIYRKAVNHFLYARVIFHRVQSTPLYTSMHFFTVCNPCLFVQRLTASSSTEFSAFLNQHSILSHRQYPRR